jgi:hypothetical protein
MMLETLERSTPPPPAGTATPAGAGRAERTSAVLKPWLRAQSLNVTRHAAALRPFRRDEFGSGAEAPTEAHVHAANELISTLRRDLFRRTRRVHGAVEEALAEPVTPRLQKVLTHKERAHDQVRAIEQVWDFYFELFGQRQSQFGDWLLSCDRIALDCYQYAYLGLGKARSIPAPPPFSYMRTGFSPATYRRGIPLRRLGRQLNPFPLVQLPYHRLINPWTMGAVLHEVSHNLQNELQLQTAVPASILGRLRAAGLPESVCRVWTRWNREIFGDMMGCLLGGEAFISSLMDTIGRSNAQALAYSPQGVHPTPYLRTFLSCELLGRMGFPERAEELRRTWRALYPSIRGTTIPRPLLRTWPQAVPLVVEAVCFTSFPSLGRKSLRAVITFEPRHQLMIEEAATRLAGGTDPGVVPERFLIGAVRTALDRDLATPEVLMRNFYVELSRR